MEARRSSAALVSVAVSAAAVALLLVLAAEPSRAERFVVGDAARWTWGYNYTDWVIRKGPFFQNDTLGEFESTNVLPLLCNKFIVVW